MARLFELVKIRELSVRNRIVVSPMCQYSATDGVPNDWHLVHLGSRAVGGAGVVMVEATAVSPEGRISSADLGIWNDEQVAGFKKITQFLEANGAAPAIQIAHAGRKAGTAIPWVRNSESGADWKLFAPSAIPFSEKSRSPIEMKASDIEAIARQFELAAARALEAGFKIIEVHMAHGYLLNEFLSPLSNKRSDEYGGSFENRTRLPKDIVARVRKIWPSTLPLFVRISATDWVDGGWTIGDSVRFSSELKTLGADLIDCSSGGLTLDAKIPVEPGFQVPFAHVIKKETGVMTGAVGLITEAHQANMIIEDEHADFIFMARELLRNPYWPLGAAKELGADIDWPKPYLRAKN